MEEKIINQYSDGEGNIIPKPEGANAPEHLPAVRCCYSGWTKIDHRKNLPKENVLVWVYPQRCTARVSGDIWMSNTFAGGGNTNWDIDANLTTHWVYLPEDPE